MGLGLGTDLRHKQLTMAQIFLKEMKEKVIDKRQQSSSCVYPVLYTIYINHCAYMKPAGHSLHRISFDSLSARILPV